MVINTRVQHSHAHGGYRSHRVSCEHGAKLLGYPTLRDANVGDLKRAEMLRNDETFRRVRHVVTENARVLDTIASLETQGPREIGELLTASHTSLRDDFDVSAPELYLAVDAALAVGALGARMTGGRFGGSAIALVERADAAAVESAVRTAFQSAWATGPHIFPVQPSAGARRAA